MYLTIFNKKIYYEEYGKDFKKTILIIHGGPGASCLDFVKIAQKLGENFHIITTDQLGVLRSSEILEDEKYTMEIQVEIFEEMRKQLGISKWFLLGHSYGGQLSSLYAMTYPNSILGIIFECPSLDFHESVINTSEILKSNCEKENDLESLKIIKKIEDERNKPMTKEISMDLINLLNRIKDPKTRQFLNNITIEKYFSYMDFEGIEEDMWKKSERHLFCLLDDPNLYVNYLLEVVKFDFPILMLATKYDHALSKKQLDFFSQHSKNAKAVFFENSGHFPRFEEPEKYIFEINRFLKNL